MPTFVQVYEPVANSLLLSALVAVIPIAVLFILLAGLRVAAHWASLASLAVALIIAVAVYGMPVSLALNSTLAGAAVVLIAFVFGALLEATAGFGTPVAITAALMAGLGFEAVYAAALALLANTAPVAFGGFGIPILTGAQVSQLDTLGLSQMVGRQTPILALIVPGFLVVVMSGWRRMLEVWPIVVVSGVAFAGSQFLISNLLGPALADLLASIIAVVAVVALLSFWRPREEWHFSNEPPAAERASYESPPLGRTLYAWSPFIILVVVLLLSQMPGI